MKFIKIINRIFHWLGREFQNFVFRKRLGRKRWSVKLIIRIMKIFSLFEAYSNTGEVGRFDHYVPQFLLNKWRIAESGTDKGKIFYWSKTTNLIEKASIKSEIGGEINWDVTQMKGVQSDFIGKKIFAESLELRTPKIIRLINDNPSLDLTFLEESTLAVFIANQITRVPAFRKSLLRFFSVACSKNLMNHDDFGNKESLIEKVVLNQVGITYDQFLHDTTSVTIEGKKPQLILVSLMIAFDIAEKIYRGNLHILEIPTGSTDEFVLSDNPVVFVDFDRKEILHFVPWWEVGKKDFLIFMPISTKKAVFFCKSKRKDGPIENDNEDFVQMLNFGQYLCCSDNVFAQRKEIIEQHISFYKDELCRILD